MFVNCINLSRITCECVFLLLLYWVTCSPLSLLFLGMDVDVVDVDDSLINHFDALGFDSSFQSWE